MADRVKVLLTETDEIIEVFYIDAQEMIKAGQGEIVEDVACEPTIVKKDEPASEAIDRDAVKAELTEMGVDFSPSAPTKFLAKLLAEAKEKGSNQ